MRIHHIILKDKFLQPAKAFFDSPEFESTWHEVNYEALEIDDVEITSFIPQSCDLVFIHFLIPRLINQIEAVARLLPVGFNFGVVTTFFICISPQPFAA